nr:MAG TPA: hypothetical protein [Caudoviricetes sp.]
MEQSIYRGTTPSITLNVKGVDLSDASVWPTVIVTVENGRSTFDVTRDNITIAKTEAGSSVTFALTQHQTLLMHKLQKTLVQLRAKDADGHAIATEIASVTSTQPIGLKISILISNRCRFRIPL